MGAIRGPRERLNTLGRVAARAPRWLQALLGLACTALGVALVTRPLSSVSTLVLLVGVSLIVSGVTDLVTGARSGPTSSAAGASGTASGRLAWLVAGAWIAAGVAVLALPSVSAGVLTLVVAGALVLSGLVNVLAGLRGGAPTERVSTLIGGAARAVLGVVALAWPDVTLLVVAAVFGAGMVVFGLTRLFAAVFGRSEVEHAPDAPPAPWRRGLRIAGSVLALAAALLVLSLGLRIRESVPVVDAFYAPPADLPDAPGVLLRSEPFRRGVPEGANAWRILYTTTRDDLTPGVASALVVAPSVAPNVAPSVAPNVAPSVVAGEGTPVLAWAHGTTGFAQHCAPSLLDEPFESGALFVLDDVIAEGWTLVATDYLGLGTAGPHPYLIGGAEARSVLDAVRAARQLEGPTLDDKTVVWGHSQGGGAALWTGIIAPEYAPDVPIEGVAALAPASDIVGLVDDLPNVTGGTVFASYVIAAYTAIFDDVSFIRYVRPAAQILTRQMAGRCLSGPGVLVSVLAALSVSNEQSIFRRDLTGGPFWERLAENVPTSRIAAPLLIAQGAADTLIKPGLQAGYVRERCLAGQELEYRSYPDLGHVSLVEADSPLVPDLIAWTRARFGGTDPLGGCSEVTGSAP